MRLNHIKLEHFRNHKGLDISFDPTKNINIFIGDNAQGKTNFLEAIATIAFAKSFRTTKHDTLVQWEQNYTKISATISRKKTQMQLEYFLSNAPKKQKNMRKNGVNVPVRDFIGQLTVVLFNPEDLNMLILAPSLRRKYLNLILSQIDPLYFDALITYNRTIKQRNKLLQLINENQATRQDLYVWNEKLAETGTYILQKRLDLIDFYNKHLSEKYAEIVQSKNKILVNYDLTIDKVDNKENYLKSLDKSYESDIRYNQTTKGVHRDDITFTFDGKNISEFGSRGELRTLIIALKLTEIDFIKEETGEKPILLLDDVFSELDKKRQQFLLKTIKKYQSFVTMTHNDFSLENAAVFEISNGSLK